MQFRVVDDQISANFRLRQFANSLDRNSIMLTADFIEFVQVLQMFRTWYNRPINISSGFRTPEFNRSVGGSSNSAHLRGVAVDFPLPPEWWGFSRDRRNQFIANVRKKWHKLCRKVGRRGSVVFYDTFIHLDFWHVERFEDNRTSR